MPEPQPKKDPPVCRQDLIEKSAESGFESDFDWVNDKEIPDIYCYELIPMNKLR